MKNKFRLLCLLLLAACVSPGPVPAWDRGTVAYEGPPGVSISPVIVDSMHLLKSSAAGVTLRLNVRNELDRPLAGALLYAGITDFQGRGRQDFTVRLDIPAGESRELSLAADSLRGCPGFYDVRVLAFDHGRELGGTEFTFGLDVDAIDTPPYPPADFDAFWDATRDSLSAIPLEAEVRKEDSLCSADAQVFRVSYLSLHGVRVHGWLTLPARGKGPFPAFLILPGYSGGHISPQSELAAEGWASLAIQVRGYEVDRKDYPPDNSRYMTIGIDSPETYIYREIICHCLRGLDLLASRPEVDMKRLGVRGGSQGGGLSLLTAGLDRRVCLVSAGVPFLTDFPLSMTMTGSPYREVVDYIRQHRERREAVMHTLAYVDVLNVAGRITAPVLVSAGLFDRTCPAPSIYGMFLRLASKDKTIRLYPYLDHLEVQGSHSDFEHDWLVRHLSAAGQVK